MEPSCSWNGTESRYMSRKRGSVSGMQSEDIIPHTESDTFLDYKQYKHDNKEQL